MQPKFDDKQRERRRRTRIAIAVIFLAVAYPLSFGPVLYLDMLGYLDEPYTEWLYRTVYAPCNWLFELSNTYNNYISWWIESEIEDVLTGA